MEDAGAHDAQGAGEALTAYRLGEQQMQAGRLEEAAQSFRQALALDTQFAEAHANLGYVLDQMGQHAEAEGHYRRALKMTPDNAPLHLNLGALLALQKRHAEAEASYGAALALEPDSSAVWSNLGVLNLNLKNDERAEACLRKAMALDPANTRARFNLAYLRLRHGHFEEGWALFEARDWYRAMEQQLAFPRWRGEALEGLSLLVTYEAGHGDVIQFCRYVPLLKAAGAAHITLLCHPALKELMATLDGLDAVCGFDDALGAQHFDYWMPLMSAPPHLGTGLDTVPATLPYLHADTALRATWSARLLAGPLRVGLVWKGNPQFENDSDRSLPHLRMLAPLWQVPGAAFVSLQKGAGEAEVAACSAQQPLTELGSRMRHFADAAAIVAELDLVIAVDTAMAHLAGALGKPCWLLLPWYMTDWRWGAEGSASVWYPDVVRLFRQGPDGDWNPVIADVALALLERKTPRGAPCR
ncbi:MAG: tetratricopeptide repeat protein [Rhodoferax sp.]|nr:tetratricopeptide repeat protein [Rhodoferax sp.]